MEIKIYDNKLDGLFRLKFIAALSWKDRDNVRARNS